MRLGVLINLASIALASSVVMDSYFWMIDRYMIPSWTIAVMSVGVIILLQVIRVYKVIP